MSRTCGTVGSVYRPRYRNGAGQLKESAVWWIRYSHHGTKYRESSKSEAKAVAKEGAKYKIRSSVICPGFVRTPLVEQQIPTQAQQFGLTEEEVIKNIMLRETVDGEFTSMEDVAETAVFLASFASNALTGQSIVVSHGHFMH